MILGPQRHNDNGCKKKCNKEADDSWCAHRVANCRKDGNRATPNAFGADLELAQAGDAPALQLNASQSQRVGDYGNRAKAHRRAGDHRAEKNAKQWIKNAGRDWHAERIVDEGEE